MNSVREGFVQLFGEDLAAAIDRAANEHGDSWSSGNKGRGSDEFKWALCQCIGFDCIVKPQYMIHHEINPEAGPAIKQWIREHGELDTHDGDVDILALMTGAYLEYMPDGASIA